MSASAIPPPTGRRRSASNASSQASQEDQEEEIQEREVPVVAVAQDSGPTAKTFAFHKEDHTLGNVLRYVVMQDPKVLAAGYTVPHPLEAFLHVRIETVPNEEEKGEEVKATSGEGGELPEQMESGDMAATTKSQKNKKKKKKKEEEESSTKDAQYTAEDALRTGLRTLKQMCQEARSSFDSAMEEYLASKGT